MTIREDKLVDLVLRTVEMLDDVYVDQATTIDKLLAVEKERDEALRDRAQNWKDYCEKSNALINAERALKESQRLLTDTQENIGNMLQRVKKVHALIDQLDDEDQFNQSLVNHVVVQSDRLVDSRGFSFRLEVLLCRIAQ